MSYIYTKERLEDIILFHKYLYYEKSDPMISDYDYDQLEKKLQEIAPNSKVLTEYIECPREFWPKYERRYKHFKKSKEDIKNDEFNELINII